MTDQLANQERKYGSRDHVLNEYMRRKTDDEEARREVSNSQCSLNLMLKMAKIRKDFIKTFRSSIMSQARYCFQSLLHNRNFEGELLFDFKERTLDLLVTPLGRNAMPVEEPVNKRSKSSHASDIRTLSGGERSFATVCFILSLWDAIDSPFRILDEFEVFMVIDYYCLFFKFES